MTMSAATLRVNATAYETQEKALTRNLTPAPTPVAGPNPAHPHPGPSTPARQAPKPAAPVSPRTGRAGAEPAGASLPASPPTSRRSARVIAPGPLPGITDPDAPVSAAPGSSAPPPHHQLDASVGPRVSASAHTDSPAQAANRISDALNPHHSGGSN
jgi:hypothetical protein